jgi:hypothetical protein
MTTSIEILEKPVRMSVLFKRDGDREKVSQLVDCIRHHDPSIGESWLLGVGKMFYDLGVGIDIWDTAGVPPPQILAYPNEHAPGYVAHFDGFDGSPDSTDVHGIGDTKQAAIDDLLAAEAK